MKILGIDPGYGIVGFGIIELVGSDWEVQDYGVITTDKDMEMSERLLAIYEDISEVIAEHEPNICAIEELFFVQNVTTGMYVAEARGVLRLAAIQAGLELYEYKPNEIKMSVTGYGKADKHQVQKMVQTILNLNSIPQPDDAADALAIALTCAFEVVRI